MGVPLLWKESTLGKGIIIALLDTGVNTNHPDLKDTIWKNPGESGFNYIGEAKENRSTNGIDDDNNGYIDDIMGWNFMEKNNNITDTSGHGTEAAGILVGQGKGIIKTGVAPEAQLMVLRACCSINREVQESALWEAIQYAVMNGAKVISMSITLKDATHPHYATWRKVGEALLAAKVVHVNSAGNQSGADLPFQIGAPASNPPAWGSQLGNQTHSLSSMISVGATDPQDKIRSYSSRGPVTWESVPEYKDFPFAGGTMPGLMKPEVCAPSEVPSLSFKDNGYVTLFGATSSSAPHIAGVVALLLSEKPGLTPTQITKALQLTAAPVDGKWNNKCGGGRVNAYEAMRFLWGSKK
jgi:subtilisin family serine protease